MKKDDLIRLVNDVNSKINDSCDFKLAIVEVKKSETLLMSASEESSYEEKIQILINNLDYERQQFQEEGNWEKAHSLHFRMAMLAQRL